MVKFAVLGLQRTGTTLVVSTLNSHPRILSLGELFEDKEKIAAKVVPTYKLYMKQLDSGPNNAAPQKERIFRYLDTVFAGKNFDAVGFKLMFNQGRKYPPISDYLKENRFKIIRVIRKNLLKTCISRFRARQTGLWDSFQPIFNETRCRETGIKIPVEDLLHELNSVAAQDKALEQTVLNLNLEYIAVSYEEFNEKKPGETQKMLNFLGIDGQIRLNTRLQKVSPEELTHSLKNYEEIVDALKHTPYAEYLE